MPRKFFRPHAHSWRMHEETRTEAALGQLLRARGWRVQQEAAVGPYHVDFLVEGRVVVEVDGSSHLVSGRREQDRRRDGELLARGFQVVRVPAEAVARQSAQVYLERIARNLEVKRPPPAPRWGDHDRRWRELQRRLRPLTTSPQPSMEQLLDDDAEVMRQWLENHPVIDKDESGPRSRSRAKKGGARGR